VGDGRFGPNSQKVESFLDRLSQLTPKQWNQVQRRSPSSGSVPELEVAAAPRYFQAFRIAAQAAKANVFAGSETAFFDAMRTAYRQATTVVNGLGGTARKRPALALGRKPETDDPEAILDQMADEFENETWAQAVHACMIAAGALVMRGSVDERDFTTLWLPLQGAGVSPE
jgi:hypothetical protein